MGQNGHYIRAIVFMLLVAAVTIGGASTLEERGLQVGLYIMGILSVSFILNTAIRIGRREDEE